MYKFTVGSISSIRLRTFGYSSKTLAQSPGSLCSEDCSIDDCAGKPTCKWRDPAEPQLIYRPTADEDRRTCAARGVDGCVGYGNADQVNERQAQPDRDGSKSLGRALISRAEDDEQKEQGQHQFSHKTRG